MESFRSDEHNEEEKYQANISKRITALLDQAAREDELIITTQIDKINASGMDLTINSVAPEHKKGHSWILWLIDSHNAFLKQLTELQAARAKYNSSSKNSNV